MWRSSEPCRMLKKTAGFALASLRGSTYRAEYALPLRSLRPRLGGRVLARRELGW